MGRTTARLVALTALLSAPAAAQEAPHQRLLLGGDVPVRFASDDAPVCGLALRVAADVPTPDWAQALRAAHAGSGLRVEAEAAHHSSLSLSVPAPEAPAVLATLGRTVRAEAPSPWRTVALVCPGQSKDWLKLLDAAFRRTGRVDRALPGTSPRVEPLTITSGPAELGFRWVLDDRITQVEADLGLRLRADTVEAALDEEEIPAQVGVDRRSGVARLTVTFDDATPPLPVLELVEAALREHEEAPPSAQELDSLWDGVGNALLRLVDSPRRRAEQLADQEQGAADPFEELGRVRRASPRSFHAACAALAVERATRTIQHPRPPNHGDLYEAPKKERNRLLEPSFDEEDE